MLADPLIPSPRLSVCSQQSYVLITKGLSFPNLIELLGTGFISLGSPLLLSCCWSKGGIHALAMISAVNRRSSNNKENINNKANANVIFALLKCGLWRFLLGDSLVVQWWGLGDFTARAWIQSLVRELGSHQPKKHSGEDTKITSSKPNDTHTHK